MTTPKISVVMSVYNGEKYLREAVESILNQTFRDFELIIIDDGSTDGTAAILDSYTDPRIVRLHNSQNIGLTRSLNRGLVVARGEFVARQDADDVSLPERLAIQIEYLQQHSHVGLLGTAYHVWDEQGRCTATHRQPLTDTEIRWQMLFHNAFCHTSVMFRRELVNGDESFYNEDLLYGQDYDFWAKLLRRTCAANLQTPLVARRPHDSSTSATHLEEQQHICSTIAAQQINLLIPQLLLTPSESDTLRHWYFGLPQRLSKQDMVLCRVLLQILSAFEKQQNVDPDIVRSIRQRWIIRILIAAPVEYQKDLWTAGLFGFILRDAPYVLAYASKRAILRIRRVLKIT